jgi:hypothetical protein
MGQQVWIEAFAIHSVGSITADLIEYRGLTAEGVQTPWLSSQILCGSRGRGMPLVGFAVRLKPEIADRYDCIYRGRFAAAGLSEPLNTGDLCSSSVPGDPLEAFELRIVERSA